MQRLGTLRILAAAAFLAAAVGADDRDSEVRDLKERLERAERRIDEMNGRDAGNLDAAVREYLAGARSAEGGGTSSAGYDDGFFLRSGDRRWSIVVNGQLQLRALYNNTDESLDDAHRWGFENTRSKLVFHGNAGDERLGYRIQGNFLPDGGRLTLEDCYVSWDFGNGLYVVAGQFKCPVLREEKVDSACQLAVERSNLNDVFTSGERFGGGVAATYTTGPIRLFGAFTDGDGTANSPALAADNDFAATFRGEWLVDGRFEAFDDFTSFPGEERSILVALNAHTQKGESGTTAVETLVVLVALDVSVELGGANLFGEFIYMNVDRTGNRERGIFGFVAQGGYFVTRTIEIFARFEYGDLDDIDLPVDRLSVGTIGANWYWNGHQRKFTVDLSYGFDPVPAVGRYSGLRVDNPLADGQFVFRMQFQVLF